MRILHVVSFISPDGAFGGPIRVAEHQASALRERGHDVTVLAGQRGYDPPLPSSEELRLFPARQLLPTGTFAGVAAPRMLPAARREIRRSDIVHVHVARDLLTLPVALMATQFGVPCVVQPHGMIDESDRRSAHLLDRLATRRVLRRAAKVLVFRDVERRSLETVVGGPLPTVMVRNAVPRVAEVPPLPEHPEVLFCARLHERKRPLAFVRMAKTLLDEGVDASFVLVGPDEGEGPAVDAEVRAVGDAGRLRWEGALDRGAVLERMGRSSVLVLPSFDEPYPISVLEAMSLGRPVVITETNGLAPEVADTDSGIVVPDDDVDTLVAAVRGLLASPSRLARMGAQARDAANGRFSLEGVAKVLEDTYVEVIGEAARGR
jgi:glycosyltransferase involved in cell wall biosynthesis